jgi:exonuclease I
MPKDAETLAKLRRDPRTATYTGGYVVELDALVAYAPKQFRQIIEDALNEKWDRSIKEELDDEANEMYDKLEEILEDIKERAKEKILKELK